MQKHENQMYPLKDGTVDLDTLKPKQSPYKIGLGGSLFILVRPDGKKFWRFKYRFQGRENQLSFGQYPFISLEKAIAQRDEAKAMIKAGVSPAEAKRERRQEKKKPRPSFLMKLSEEGSLIIETRRSFIHLAPEQTQALRLFLNAGNSEASFQ